MPDSDGVVRKLRDEVLNGRFGIETDFDRVRSHERATENATGQPGDVVALERLEHADRNLRRARDLTKGDAPLFPRSAEPGAKVAGRSICRHHRDGPPTMLGSRFRPVKPEKQADAGHACGARRGNLVESVLGNAADCQHGHTRRAHDRVQAVQVALAHLNDIDAAFHGPFELGQQTPSGVIDRRAGPRETAPVGDEAAHHRGVLRSWNGRSRVSGPSTGPGCPDALDGRAANTMARSANPAYKFTRPRPVTAPPMKLF